MMVTFNLKLWNERFSSFHSGPGTTVQISFQVKNLTYPIQAGSYGYSRFEVGNDVAQTHPLSLSNVGMSAALELNLRHLEQLLEV